MSQSTRISSAMPFGADKVDKLSSQTGLPRHALLDELAQVRPIVIDRLTPQGRLPDAAGEASSRV
jgi:uncharacterized protein YidB (DUF937 family)